MMKKLSRILKICGAAALVFDGISGNRFTFSLN